MRIGFGILYFFLVVALCVCAVLARRSNRPIGKSVALMLVGLVPPVLGNLLIILSSDQALSTVGCYIYFLGMDLAIFALIRFTFDYCNIAWPNRGVQALVYGLLIVDAVQLLLNPVFGHAFTTEPIMVHGAYYYSLVPLAGQTFHRIVDYSIFAAAIIIFIVKMARAPRIDVERYGVILFVMLFTGLWQTFYIFSRTPVDRSMIGFAVFGLLIYFFALRYKPVRLLDHMLANVASEIPEALFFFDVNGQCIWVNAPAWQLIGVKDDYEAVPGRLRQLFGEWRQDSEEWTDQYTYITEETDDGEKTEKTCIIERHTVTDDRGRMAGRFLKIRDNTLEQQLLQREIYHATHDHLTGVYNRAGYELLLEAVDLESTCMLLLDVDRFKDINDTHGHAVGDLILKKVIETVTDHFRSVDPVSRIGGDEFVILLSGVSDPMDELIGAKIDGINGKLGQDDGSLPVVSISAGIAYGRDAKDREHLFEQADRALYTAKERGRKRHVFYRDVG